VFLWVHIYRYNEKAPTGSRYLQLQGMIKGIDTKLTYVVTAKMKLNPNDDYLNQFKISGQGNFGKPSPNTLQFRSQKRDSHMNEKTSSICKGVIRRVHYPTHAYTSIARAEKHESHVAEREDGVPGGAPRPDEGGRDGR